MIIIINEDPEPNSVLALNEEINIIKPLKFIVQGFSQLLKFSYSPTARVPSTEVGKRQIMFFVELRRNIWLKGKGCAQIGVGLGQIIFIFWV